MKRAKRAADRQTSRYLEDRGDFTAYGGIPKAQRHFQPHGARQFLAQHLGRDLPRNVKCRWSPRRPADAELAISETSPDVRWVLITGRAPAFIVIGWAWAREAPELGVWRDDVPLPAWFIPSSNLRDPATLATTEAAR